MSELPMTSILYIAIAVYFGYLYRCDFLVQADGKTRPGAMPGATSAPACLYGIAVAGALLILLLETVGEISLGIVGEQKELLWYIGIASLVAGIVEEVVFRGFLAVESRGRAPLIASCCGFSLVFVLLHPFLWELTYTEGTSFWKFWQADFRFILTTKSLFTSLILLLNSLWFYAIRFGSWNGERSLFPCMLAHFTSNLGVFAIKWAQGYIVF